jgi:hypothetical protein
MYRSNVGKERESEGRKTYGLRLDQALVRQVKHLGVDEDKAVNDLVEEALRDLLKKYQGKRREQR